MDVTFAFIIPYLLFVTNVAYTRIAKPQRGFATDFIARSTAGVTAYCSSVINFILYFAQMKDFPEFLKKVLPRNGRHKNRCSRAAQDFYFS